MTKPDHTPAFPVPEPNCHYGMSLRDYFAAAALTGVLANDWGNGNPLGMAHAAYAHADAMLEKREKPNAE